MIVKALTPISHNNRLFEIDEIFEIDDETANQLLRDPQPAITPTDAPAATPEPEPGLGEGKKGAFNKPDNASNPVDAPAATPEPPVEPQIDAPIVNQTPSEPQS